MPLSKDRILYLDDDLIAVSKRSGELTVKGKGAVGKLPLLDYLKKDYPEVQTLHRLDFETSGVVVFARSKQVAAKVKERGFGEWGKVYVALVVGVIGRSKGVIRKELEIRGRGASGVGRRVREDRVSAITSYSVLERFGNSSLVEVEIETGRQHQIRKHFASIEHPLVLDHVYGHKKYNNVFTSELGYRKFFLHASRVEFPHPVTGEKVVVEAEMPRAFGEVLEKLRS